MLVRIVHKYWLADCHLALNHCTEEATGVTLINDNTWEKNQEARETTIRN